MNTYILDYFSKYYFFEEEDFLKEDEGEFILNKIKESNRFEYKGYSYKLTKYGNISKGETKRNVQLKIDEELLDVEIEGERVHLNLNYKFDTKRLEDHLRITTKISEKKGDPSCLLYLKFEEEKGILDDLNKIKDNIERNMKLK